MQFNNRKYQIKVWSDEQLNNLIAFDCETEMITHESIIPELITLQVYDGSDTVYFVEADSIASFFDLHVSTDNKFIAHNAKFDMSVLQRYIGEERLYSLYDNNQIVDTAILFRLLHLATIGHLNTRYSLDYCVKRMTGIELPKDAEIRTTFAQFKGRPVLEIPQGHLEYAAKDAIATLQLYLRLMPEIAAQDQMGTNLSHDIQVKGDWALGCMMRNGIGFDLARKEEWLKEQDETLLNLQRRLANYGWVRGQKGVNQRFEEILKWLGVADKLPLTATGSISSKTEDLKDYRDIPFIDDYLSFNELEKATSFVRDVEVNRIHPRYNLMVNTGRTSCSKPNFQQLPKLGGIREMFIADKDKTFVITDYNAIELSTLAQVTYKMFGHSQMRDIINEGVDLHKYYASVMRSCTIEEVIKTWRQEAKAANFGFPGGLGIDTFITFARGYGLELTHSQAQAMKDIWFQAFPEMHDYMKNEQGEVFTLTGRKRGNTTYCAEKNTPFQGLAADGAKLAMYLLCKNGFKVVGFCHDEVICEVPENNSEELMKDMERIMIEGMRLVVPDVLVGVESQISKHYTK